MGWWFDGSVGIEQFWWGILNKNNIRNFHLCMLSGNHDEAWPVPCMTKLRALHVWVIQWHVTRGGGGVLPMWWVIHMCRGFDPLFSLWQDRARSFWGIFSHPPTPKRSFGVLKVPILKECDLLGPKFHFSLDLLGSNFQRPAAHPHQFSDRVPPRACDRHVVIGRTLAGSMGAVQSRLYSLSHIHVTCGLSAAPCESLCWAIYVNFCSAYQ